jgi:hypothetical protein
VSALPAPLKPWAAQLSLLQRELALALAPAIQRLSMSIGPLADAQSQPTGAPDGYDGVARKGSYERLLITEWLFADEAPEEFLRRAAEGEHLFSRVAVREPHHARRCLVLFDAGPSQLGAPRIAHLAAFIAFASRCEAARATLTWGVLQTPTTTLREGFGKSEAEALLKARTSREATPADLSRWLEGLGHRADDVWLVGGPELLSSPAAAKVQQVEVRELMEPGVRALEVKVRRGSRVRQTVKLELPAPAICASLLRAPFLVEKPKPPTATTARPSHGLVFSASGNRLFTRGPNGEFISFALPIGIGATVKQAIFQPPALERVIAGGWHRGLVCITARYDATGRITRLVVYSLTKRGERKGEPALFEVPSAGPFPVPEGTFGDVAVLSFAGKRKLMIVLAGRAFTLDDGRIIESRDRVLAHTQRSERVMLLTLDEEGRRQVRSIFSNGTEVATLVEGLGATRAYFAGGMRSPLPILGLGEMATSPRWTLVDHSRLSFGIEVPEGGTVMGITMPSTWVAGLLVLTADKKRLLHVSAQGTQVVIETENEIVEVATDYEFPRAAWLDAAGGVGLFDASSPTKVLIGLPDGQGRRLMHFTEYRR